MTGAFIMLLSVIETKISPSRGCDQPVRDKKKREIPAICSNGNKCQEIHCPIRWMAELQGFTLTLDNWASHRQRPQPSEATLEARVKVGEIGPDS